MPCYLHSYNLWPVTCVMISPAICVFAVLLPPFAPLYYLCICCHIACVIDAFLAPKTVHDMLGCRAKLVGVYFRQKLDTSDLEMHVNLTSTSYTSYCHTRSKGMHVVDVCRAHLGLHCIHSRVILFPQVLDLL